MKVDNPSIPKLNRRHFSTVWRLLKSRELLLLGAKILNFVSRRTKRKKPILYSEWRKLWLQVDNKKKSQINQKISSFSSTPIIHIFLESNNQNDSLIRKTIKSLVDQHYQHWRLHANFSRSFWEKSSDLSIDERIVFENNLNLSSDNWIINLQVGDLLHEMALYEVVKTIIAKPEAKVIYTDHDHVGPQDQFQDPYMKPDWNQDLLIGTNYFEILTAYRFDLWDKCFSKTTENHELALLATSELARTEIIHIPLVLASKRVGDSNSHLTPAITKKSYPIPDPPPLVSVLIPTKNKGRLLERCTSSLHELTSYSKMELILVDHESNETYSRKVLNSLSQKSNVKIINFSGPFNYAEMMNNAARSANGEILVLLNNDTEIIEPDWLEELVAQVSRPEVGVVGALLLFKNGTVQHAGIHPGINSFMNHGHKHWPGNHPGYFGRLLIAHEVAAVTGACLAIKTSDWERLGGMDENNLAVAYNDVDLCLKARSMGKKIIFTPHAKLIHHESLSRGFEENSLKKERLSKEIKVMQERWGELLNSDPAYNPNLDQKSSSFILNDKPLNQPEWAIK